MRLKTARFSCERHGADSATLTGASLRPPAAGRLARPHCPRALRRPLGPPPDPRGRHTVVPDGVHVTAPPQSAVVWPTVHFLILGLVVHPRCGNSRFVRSGNFLTTHPPPPRVGSPGPSRAPRGTSARASAARTAPPFRLPASRS